MHNIPSKKQMHSFLVLGQGQPQSCTKPFSSRLLHGGQTCLEYDDVRTHKHTFLKATTMISVVWILGIITFLQCVQNTLAAQEDVYGNFLPDGKCVPSMSCCCVTSLMNIAPATSGDGAVVTADLDGGQGCRNFGSVSSVFTHFPLVSYQTVNSTAIAWSLPVYGDKYIAAISESYERITISRVIQNPIVEQPCTNYLYRARSGVPIDGGVLPSGPASAAGTTSNRGNGAFEVINAPIKMGANVQESIYDADSRHRLKYGVFRVSAASEQYDVWINVISKEGFNSSLNWADIHFITPTTDNPSTATIASPINKVMVQQDTAGQTFRYGPIPVSNGSGLRISFSYLMKGHEIVHTPTYFFQGSSSTTATGFAGGSGGGGTGNCEPVCTTGNPSEAMRRQYRLLGVYQTDTSKCTSGQSCCCSVGSITATEVTTDRTKITLAGSLDGSNACAGQTVVAGDFTINGERTASYTYPEHPITLTLQLSEDGKTLEFTNSMYTCKSYATRTSSVPLPSTETVCNVPANCNNGNNNGNGGGGNGGERVCTKKPADEKVKRQYRFEGNWKRNPAACTSGSSCCCAGSDMVAKIVTNNSSRIFLKGTLDGSQACAGQNDVEGEFSILDDTTATYTYPDYPITLTYKISADANTATFSNNMYTCTSQFTRASGGPSTIPAEVEVCTGGSGNNGGGNGNGNQDVVITETMRSQVVGTWVSTGACNPTQNCCCVKGTMSILKPQDAASNPAFPPPQNSQTADANAVSTVYVYGGLDGGVACMRKTDMSGFCTLQSGTHGSCRLEGITFDAQLTGTNQMTISNSKYLNCNSVVKKVSHIPTTEITSAAIKNSSPGISIAIYCFIAIASLLFYVKIGIGSL